MKSKEEITKRLDEVEAHLGANPLSLEDWAHWEGQKHSLLFALDIKEHDMRNVNKILEGANDETIKNAQQKLSDQTGFGIPPTNCVDDH